MIGATGGLGIWSDARGSWRSAYPNPHPFFRYERPQRGCRPTRSTVTRSKRQRQRQGIVRGPGLVPAQVLAGSVIEKQSHAVCSTRDDEYFVGSTFAKTARREYLFHAGFVIDSEPLRRWIKGASQWQRPLCSWPLRKRSPRATPCSAPFAGTTRIRRAPIEGHYHPGAGSIVASVGGCSIVGTPLAAEFAAPRKARRPATGRDRGTCSLRRAGDDRAAVEAASTGNGRGQGGRAQAGDRRLHLAGPGAGGAAVRRPRRRQPQRRPRHRGRGGLPRAGGPGRGGVLRRQRHSGLRQHAAARRIRAAWSRSTRTTRGCWSAPATRSIAASRSPRSAAAVAWR